MGGLELAILAALVVALLLFAVYLSDARREKGQDPFYAREVYLYRGDAPTLTLAAARRAGAALGAEVAAAGQVAVYAADGGRAPGCGLVAEGRAAQLLPAAQSAPLGVAEGECDLAACGGVWLYGPKPRRQYPGVAPFDATHWFQPSA